jgi:hypothetical protein
MIGLQDKTQNSDNLTKKIFFYSLSSLFLIIILIVTPLNNIFSISLGMKLIIIYFLSYTFYLNIKETNILRQIDRNSKIPEIMTQINVNIICSYFFSFFIGLLIIFVIKKL